MSDTLSSFDPCLSTRQYHLSRRLLNQRGQMSGVSDQCVHFIDEHLVGILRQSDQMPRRLVHLPAMLPAIEQHQHQGIAIVPPCLSRVSF